MPHGSITRTACLHCLIILFGLFGFGFVKFCKAMVPRTLKCKFTNETEHRWHARESVS